MEDLQDVQKIFSNKLLRIPDYQRGYAWEEKHWKDMIEDLELLLPKQDHYTGTLVLHLNNSDLRITDEEGGTLHICDIVDGQQRLTTLIILLDCISKELKKIEGRELLADGIKKKYIKIRDIEKQDKTRLTLNKDCHDYFVRNILSGEAYVGGEIIKSHERMKGAQDFFFKYFEEKKLENRSGYENWLIELMTKITSFLKFTVYKVTNTSDVGVIFEVMNNRGKSLSEMEKVKNYLLYVSSKILMNESEELAKKINKTWTKIFESLMEADASEDEFENQLLRSSWLMAYNYSPREWGGYSSIKNEFSMKKYESNKEKLLGIISKYVDILAEACIAYCDIISPHRSGSYLNFRDRPRIRKRLQGKTEKLFRLRNLASFLPLLMATRMKYADNYEFQEELLDICEKYSFRIYRLHNHRSNTGQYSLFRDGYNLFKGRRSPKQILNNIKNLLISYSSNSKFIETLKSPEMNWYHFTGLKYFLYEYEEQLSKGRGVRMAWDFLMNSDKKNSIEHILPQTPNKPYWKEHWTEDKIKTYLHDIGNLTLTFDNSVYSNKPFPEKKGSPGISSCYANSGLFMEKELASYNDWTEKELLKRQKKLVDWAKDRWYVSPTEEFEKFEIEEDLESESSIYEGMNNDFDDEPHEDEDLKLEEWTKVEIRDYLDYLKGYGGFTYYYFKALASEQKKFTYSELIEKVGNLTQKEFSSSHLAGVLSGLNRRTVSKGKEKLDWRDDEEWIYALNEKYRIIISDYIKKLGDSEI